MVKDKISVVMSNKKINILISQLIYFLIILTIFFGKKFALIKIVSFPGYILDYSLIFLLLISSIANYAYLKNRYYSKDFYLIIYSVIIILIFYFNSYSDNINETFQDLIILIYPLLVFIITKNIGSFEVNLRSPLLKIIMYIYPTFLILDFILDRAIIVDSFLGLSLSIDNLNNINLSILRPTESFLFLCLVIFLDINVKNKPSIFPYVTSGIYFGFVIVESRTVLVTLALFFLLFVFENDFKKTFKLYLFLFLGILISFTLNLSSSVEKINNQILNSPNESGTLRVRDNSFECLIDLQKRNNTADNCESNLEIIRNFHLGLLKESYTQGFRLDSIEKAILKYELILKKHKTTSEVNFINSACRSTPSRVEINLNCDEFIREFDELIYLKNKAYEDLCGDNISWRINLWKNTIFYNNKYPLNHFFGNGVGFSIPQKLVSEDFLPIECYQLSISGSKPLRNAHNTFLTVYYRFGLINLFLIGYILLKISKKFYKKNIFSLFALPFMITFFDPIIDNPVTMFVVFFYFAILIKFKENEEYPKHEK